MWVPTRPRLRPTLRRSVWVVRGYYVNKSDVLPHPLVPLTMEVDPQWGTSRPPDEQRRVENNPDASRVKTRHPPAVMVEADEELAGVVVVAAAGVVAAEEVEEVKEEVEVEEVAEEEVIPHLPRPSDRVLPDAVPDDNAEIAFSIKLRCSNSWNKSCKINSRRPLDVASQVSRPPTPSRPPIKTDNVPPRRAIRPVYGTECIIMMRNARRRRTKRRRQMGGAMKLVKALVAPFTKKAATSLVKALGKRAAKGAAMGAAGAGVGYGVRKIKKKIMKRRR